MLKLVKVMKDIKNINIRKVLKNSSHDAVIKVFILAQKGKMAFKAPFVPRELRPWPLQKVFFPCLGQTIGVYLIDSITDLLRFF